MTNFALFSSLVPQSAGNSPGGEANLVLPDLSVVHVVGGASGRLLLLIGLVLCVLGLGFGVMVFLQLRKLPVHPSMKEISELI